MKRPYIPLKIRVRAAEIQATRMPRIPYQWWMFYHNAIEVGGLSMSKRLGYLLEAMFGGEDVQLDHCPALCLRKKVKDGRYKPDANDPIYLVYRLKPDHLKKTTGRNPGATRTITTKGSDVWLAKKFRKLEKPKKSRSKIPSRPFPKAKRALRKRTL